MALGACFYHPPQAVLGRAHFPALPAWTQTFDSAWGRGVVRVEFSQPLHLEDFWKKYMLFFLLLT